MSRVGLTALSEGQLEALADEIRTGRLALPLVPGLLAAEVGGADASAVAGALAPLAQAGLTPPQVATVLTLVAEDRRGRRALEPHIDLVATGPEALGVASRDTSVVVRDLFRHAQASVLVLGYVVRQGRQVFQALADRMREHPALQVRLCLDVRRVPGDTSLESGILQRFATQFRAREWPGERVPEIYYDPRALASDARGRATLHAKCIVVDREHAFISSANFTEAAQERNIEVGVLIRAAHVAGRLADHVEALIQTGTLRRLPGR